MDKCPFYKTYQKVNNSREINSNKQQNNVCVTTFNYCSHNDAGKLKISEDFLLTLVHPAGQLKCHGEEPDPDCHLKEIYNLIN